MAPEQCLGEAVTAAVDVYALGTVAFQMLTGRLPYQTESQLEMMNAQIGVPAPAVHRLASEYAPPVSAAVRAMLHKDPAQRPDPVAGIEALSAALHDHARARWPLGVLGATVIGGLVAGGLWMTRPDPPAVIDAEVIDAGPRDAGRTHAGVPDAAVPDAGRPDAKPSAPAPIMLRFDDAPKGLQVRLGDRLLTRAADGRLQLPHGVDALQLTLSAPRHVTRDVGVTPDRDQRIDARLRPRKARRTAPSTDLHSIDNWQ
jgi:hypothetical protein